MSTRSPAASKVPEFQKARMVNFIIDNPILSSHKFQGQKERLLYKEKWTELTELLNGIENGLNLPTTAWQREWTMLKNVVKEKIQNLDTPTKLRSPKGSELTPVEESVADFLSSDPSDLSVTTYPDSDTSSVFSTKYRAGTSRNQPDPPQYLLDGDDDNASPRRTPLKRTNPAAMTRERGVNYIAQTRQDVFSPSPAKVQKVEPQYEGIEQTDPLNEIRNLLSMQNKFLERIADSFDEMNLYLRNVSHSLKK